MCSMRTALVIASNYPKDILLESIISKENDKYAPYIYHTKNGYIHSLLLSGKHIFDNIEGCNKFMVNYCEKLKEKLG